MGSVHMMAPHGFALQHETERLRELYRYNILDTPPEGAFDRITSLAARLFNVPMAIISLVDQDRIWFKSHHGLQEQELPRDSGLCASAILFDEPWVITDARSNPHTLANPLVTGKFGLRFYAGVPLTTVDGYNLGSLCIIDRQPRSITESELANLQDLAAVVMGEMEMRLMIRKTRNLEDALSARALHEKALAQERADEQLKAETALRESETRYYDLTELSSDWHWEQDHRFRFTQISGDANADGIFLIGDPLGKTLEEIEGVSMSMRDRADYAAALESGRPYYDLTFKQVDRNGNPHHVCMSGRPIFNAAGRLRGYRGIATDFTDRKLEQEKSSQAYLAARRLAVALQTVREEERKRIARELHDDLGQLLATSRMELSLLQQKNESAGHSESAIRTIDHLLLSSIDSLRRIATDLRPKALDDGGLYYALHTLVDKFSARHRIASELTADESELALDDVHSTAIFRMIQESLANVSHHAHARKVAVELKRNADVLAIKVQDDGCGITPDDLRKNNSFGLVGMRERVHEMGGEIAVSGRKGAGTRIDIRLPV